jgi:hypothetical protein
LIDPRVFRCGMAGSLCGLRAQRVPILVLPALGDDLAFDPVDLNREMCGRLGTDVGSRGGL